MNRRTVPDISVSAKLVVYSRRNDDGSAGALILNIKNDSNVLARYAYVVIHAPLKILNSPVLFQHATLDSGSDGTGHRMSMSNHNGPPLFPHGVLKHIFYFKFGSFEPLPPHQLTYFRWVAFADEMPMKSGSFTLEDVLEDERNQRGRSK